MTGLVKGLADVKTPLSLIAFLALVLLLAFRTKRVPEFFFGLLRDKLTRQQFSDLLHRFMTLGFYAFLALLILAALAQVLDHWTQPQALTIDDLRKELAKANATETVKIHAEAEYKLAIERVNQHDLEGAIAALQESIKAIPTLTAQEMVTYLYRQKRDFQSESAAWEQAIATARKTGDTLAQARLDRVTTPRAVPEPEGDHDLIGDSPPLPKGGDRYETAARLGPGRYQCVAQKPDAGCFSWWFTTYLKSGQNLRIKFRSPAWGGLAGVGLFGTNGEALPRAGDGPDTMRGNAAAGGTLRQLDWVAPASGWYFYRIVADPGTVYRVQIS